MSIVFRRLCACLLLLAFAVRAESRPTVLTVAAASDLVYCLVELNEVYARAHPDVAIKVTNGSSGNFFAQIRAGAPYDVFMSADLHYPQQLIAAGLASAESLTPYAKGRIVLWTTRPDLDLSGGLRGLSAMQVQRLAIANPEHAPYGRAARSALKSAGRWQEFEPKLVFGENIAQTAQFVQTGNADAAILALSLAAAPRLAAAGRYVEIPAEDHEPLEQAAVLTATGSRNRVAADYIAFLRSAEARAVFVRFGFLLPDAAGPAP